MGDTNRVALAPHVREFVFALRPGAIYRVVKITAGRRDVEVVVSPTGRSVRVFVDGDEIKAGA